MAINAGETLPQEVTLQEMTDDGPQDVTVGALTKGKRVVLFAVPGAFTPTCSLKHLPGFGEKAAEFKGKGVDEILCVFVNDTFVMDAWGKDQGAAVAVRMLADGNGEFTRALELEMDASRFGMETRSRRYALIVQDGAVETLFVEPAGGLTVSHTESVLAAVD